MKLFALLAALVLGSAAPACAACSATTHGYPWSNNDCLKSSDLNAAFYAMGTLAPGSTFWAPIASGPAWFQAGAKIGLGITLQSQSVPATPAAGTFVIYMDVADSKLKAKGPSGTVTILANP